MLQQREDSKVCIIRVEVPINVSNCSSSQLYINTIYEDLNKEQRKLIHPQIH